MVDPEARPMRIAMEGLSKTFRSRRGDVAALGRVDLTVEPGEFFILLGPSGCGKSTLLNLVAGLEEPTAGVLRFGDEVVADPARGILRNPRERNVAMVFQSYALYPHMTVRANIGFPLKVAGTPASAREDEVERAARAVELESLLDALPAELSGGQRQRVAIARALVRRPGVFLMDEPLSNLDARLRAATRGRLKALQRRLGVTTLYVTHDQQEAMALGDRIAVLSKGRIEQVATPAELHARPANAFVARFAGSPPMNLLRVMRLVGAAPSSTGTGGSAPRFGAEGVEWELPPGEAGKIQASAQGTWLLGVRPEHVRILPAADAVGFEAKVDAVEIGGRDALVYLSRGRFSFLALAGPEGLRAGDTVRVEFEPGRLRLFEDDGED